MGSRDLFEWSVQMTEGGASVCPMSKVQAPLTWGDQVEEGLDPQLAATSISIASLSPMTPARGCPHSHSDGGKHVAT